MSAAVRRRFAALAAADGLGTAAYCIRAARRPEDAAALADAAGALVGWTAALTGLRSDRATAAARWVVAGTAATLVVTGAGALASLRAARPAGPSVALLAAAAGLGAAYLRVLRAAR
jgi:hypothetical protein